MKNYKITQTLFACIVLLFLGIAGASASIFVEVPLKMMCVESDHIVIARMISMNSYWGPNHQKIFTDITLEISDKIKGQLQKGDQIKMTLAGGTVDGITTLVIGGPRFIEGQESVLFISEKISAKSGKKYFKLYGLSHGKFDIFTDPTTNEKRVIRDQVDLPLRLEKLGASLPVTNHQSMSLSNFLAHVRAFVH
jgi:hypothetical protein